MDWFTRSSLLWGGIAYILIDEPVVLRIVSKNSRNITV